MDFNQQVPAQRRWYHRGWVIGGGIPLLLFVFCYGGIYVSDALDLMILGLGAAILITPATLAALPAFVLARYGLDWAAGGLILPIPTVAGMAFSVLVWALVGEGLAFMYRHRHHMAVRMLVGLVAGVIVLFMLRGALATALAPYAPELCDYAGSGRDACFTRAAHKLGDASFCHRGQWAYWDEGYLPCLEPFLTAQTPPEFCDAIQKPKSGVFNACIERLAELHRDPTICMRCTVDREQCAARVQQYIDGLSR